MMRNKGVHPIRNKFLTGFTLIELVTVLVIVTVTAGVFYGLIEKMFEAGTSIMGSKASYHQAKEAMRTIVGEIRGVDSDPIWSVLRGGPQHNFGVVDRGDTSPSAKWHWAPDNPSSPTRLVFFPDFTSILDDNGTGTGSAYQVCGTAYQGLSIHNRRVRFFWGTCTIGGQSRYCLKKQDVPSGSCDTATGTETTLAVVWDSSKGSLTVKYYDQAGNLIPVASSGLTDAQAMTISRIDLILTINLLGEPATLSKTIYVRERGMGPNGYNYRWYYTL